MTMDRQLKKEIVMEVRGAVKAAMEEYEEQWLTGEELCKQFQMFNKDWLYRYGHLLPREHVVVADPYSNISQATRWAYPKHKIARMINEGQLRYIEANIEKPTKKNINNLKQNDYERLS